MKERRLEILGILIVAVSLLVIISLLGYNSNEDPGISPNVIIENPLGILGLWIAYYFIKLGFGYMSFVLPILGLIWGVWFFTHKDFDAINVNFMFHLGIGPADEKLGEDLYHIWPQQYLPSNGKYLILA